MRCVLNIFNYCSMFTGREREDKRRKKEEKIREKEEKIREKREDKRRKERRE